jgi:hypothetical protein
MSLYQLQQCLFDYLRALENAPVGAVPPPLTAEGYDLSEAERDALIHRDLAQIYALGTHPVIINGYCRALGYKRADYRPLLQKAADPEVKRTRWQK